MVLLVGEAETAILKKEKQSCYVQNMTVISLLPYAGHKERMVHMATDYKGIGSRIKFYRTNANISQEDLAAKLNVSRRHLTNIETGLKIPSLDLLISIANALDVSADDLLVDSLKHSSSMADTEIHKLLLDCNNDEKAILTRTLTFLKALLSEYGV